VTELPRPHLLLASSSPRRLELLRRLGVEPTRVVSPDINESPKKDELPRAYVLRMAREKALAVPRDAGETLLAGDTTVAVGRRILGQAASHDEQRRFLQLISGRRHHVLSAVAVIDAGGTLRIKLSDNMVQFKRLHPDEIAAYIASGEGEGKAGGYAIQGLAEAYVKRIDGSFSGIMGLPLLETRHLLIAAGFRNL
jgi:septum formation protein